jgi:hypothetical protein
VVNALEDVDLIIDAARIDLVGHLQQQQQQQQQRSGRGGMAAQGHTLMITEVSHTACTQ